jgi:hypothetical protein
VGLQVSVKQIDGVAVDVAAIALQDVRVYRGEISIDGLLQGEAVLLLLPEHPGPEILVVLESCSHL